MYLEDYGECFNITTYNSVNMNEITGSIDVVTLLSRKDFF